MKIFVSREEDKSFYDALVKYYSSNDEIIIYDRNLYVLLKKAFRLFDPATLDRELSRPDLAIVLLSQVYVTDEWLNSELHALFMLEQSRQTNFIVPVLLGNIQDAEIPRYFREQPQKLVDVRGKSETDGVEYVVSHISQITKTNKRIFIGHGHSSAWRDLRDFLQDRLHLNYEEFNREPVAGRSNKEQLLEMLDNASFAFLVMTAEDEHADKTRHARENVIHEIGLFQGRLKFERAIILLEEGCTEFSNIAGIGQIHFAKGNIRGSFEDIRRVLEREGIV